MDSIADAVIKKQRAATSGSSSAVVEVKQHPEPRASPAGIDRPGLESCGNLADFVIDFDGLAKEGIVFQDADEHFGTTEELRHIKRPMLANADGKGASVVAHANLIMVSSSLPGEGKTFTTLNLALSTARERDRTVLLFDADVAKPHITRLLQLEDRLGLIDLLRDHTLNLGDVMLKTSVPNLIVVPAGRRDQHATELLASERMRFLVEDVATRYPNRIVLFDSPPLLVTSESHILAGLMGQIIIVVEEGRTSQAAVQKSIGMLNQDQIIGLVLNKSRHRSGAYYGGYGYGHSYGYGRYGSE